MTIKGNEYLNFDKNIRKKIKIKSSFKLVEVKKKINY
jgi:hypothetical protein